MSSAPPWRVEEFISDVAGFRIGEDQDVGAALQRAEGVSFVDA
jgi:hypothetical protein